jgi:hypothetical protein
MASGTETTGAGAGATDASGTDGGGGSGGGDVDPFGGNRSRKPLEGSAGGVRAARWQQLAVEPTPYDSNPFCAYPADDAQNVEEASPSPSREGTRRTGAGALDADGVTSGSHAIPTPSRWRLRDPGGSEGAAEERMSSAAGASDAAEDHRSHGIAPEDRAGDEGSEFRCEVP